MTFSCIFSVDKESHKQHLQGVLDRLREHGMVINASLGVQKFPI